jgi:hypothetical protein
MNATNPGTPRAMARPPRTEVLTWDPPALDAVAERNTAAILAMIDEDRAGGYMATREECNAATVARACDGDRTAALYLLDPVDPLPPARFNLSDREIGDLLDRL